MKKVTLLMFLLGIFVLLVLSACALKPSATIPDKTTFNAPFLATELASTTLVGNQVTIQIPFTNGLANAVTILGGSASGDCSGDQAFASPDSVASAESFVITWSCTTAKTKGESLRTDLTFTYTTTSGIERTHTGIVHAMLK